MLLRYFHTLRYLKPVQWRYRIYYLLRQKWRKMTGFRYPDERIPDKVKNLNLLPSIERSPMWYPDQNYFDLLNLSYQYGEKVDWSFSQFGKLWTYNLHYFEYITCRNTDPDEALKLMEDFVRKLPQNPEANEPYPISLRLIFWVRFFTTYNIQNQFLDRSLYAQAYALLDQKELHLLGNHYLENGFGLLFAAYRYADKKLYRAAESVLKPELEEQILPDGAHFERSPMYHQILLYRLLDAYNLVSNNKVFSDRGLEALFIEKAGLMLGWLQQITFRDGNIPLFNDAAFEIVPTTAALLEYAGKLGIESVIKPLDESGYRKIAKAKYEMIADIGPVGPDYIPGHAHSDTLSFELCVNGRPVVVDTGTSTYEKNEKRQNERSVFSHNTVMINGLEQSEVWGGFRVARRAYPVFLETSDDFFKASHTGYDHLKLRHVRSFSGSEDQIKITDEIHPLSGTNLSNFNAVAFLHFHPDVRLLKSGKDYIQTEEMTIVFEGAETIDIIDYEYAPTFNQRLRATKAVISFQTKLDIIMRIDRI